MEEDTIPKLTKTDIKRVQDIVGMILYYARAVNKKFIVGLRAIGSQQAAATEQTTATIDQLLDHVATYLNNGITYRDSDMVLSDHYDSGLNSKSKDQSRAGAHIYLS